MRATHDAAASGESLLARVDALRKNDPEAAWRELSREFAAASRAGDDATRGALWRTRGHVLRALQRMRPAVAAYRRAGQWYARARDTREAGRCAIGLVDALMYLGRYAEAQRAARRGRVLLERAGDRVSLARLLNNEGNIFHRLDLPDRALARYRDARRTLARAGDPRGAAMIDGNVANCLSLLGRLAEARRLYVLAQRVNEAAGFAFEALNAEYNLAYLEFLEHRYESALEGLARVRDEAGPRGYPWLAALAWLDRAEIFLRLGAHEEARAEALHAIEACGAVELGYERAKASTFAALAEFRLGMPVAARGRLEATLEAFHREGNAVWTGESLVGIATLWWRDGNPRAAAALLAAARRRFQSAGDSEREASALALLSRAWLESGELAPARAALAALRLRVAKRPTARLRHLWLAAEAAVARKRGDAAAARRWLQRAARESERLAARILDEHWRSTFWGEWGWPHRDLAALELEEGRVEAAFEALESGRGRALVGPAAQTRRATGGPLPKLVRRWAAAHQARERERTSRSAGSIVGPSSRASMDRTPGLRRALDTLTPRAIRARALRRLLPERTLLVDYMLHDGWLHAIAVGRDGLEGHRRLLSETRLAALSHAVLFGLRGAAFGERLEADEPTAIAADLAELAAAALWPTLGASLPESLAVVPVGPLARMPWAALPLPDGRALCEAMDLTLVPGLRLGLSRFEREPVTGARPLIVAADAGELASVGPETEALLATFPSAILLAGEDATAARFFELAPPAPWIHFAGHGHYRAEAPHESGLRLADRWVLAGELADLELSARWITLSACQTARALVRPGEEWFGMARSLLLCGARTVVASQWDIEDGAAGRLMSALYARLAGGAPIGAALAGAQVERLRAGAHPLEWAGFVALGGPVPGRARPDRGRPGRLVAVEHFRGESAAFPPVAVDVD
jgi:tetratricopeptide (TPR) repeat protein